MNASDIPWIVTAGGGWIVALFQYVMSYREQRQKLDQDLLAKTLSYFDGGTQRRSIGISLVEGLWEPSSKHMDIIVPVLLNQTVYLLHSSGSSEAMHEERNLIRLLSLLNRCIPTTSHPGDFYPEILDTILKKDPNDEVHGIPLTRGCLRLWFKNFGGDFETYDAEQPE